MENEEVSNVMGGIAQRKTRQGVDNIPFSAITELFTDMRVIRSRKRPSGLHAAPKAGMLKRDRLLRFWTLIAEKCCYSRDIFAEGKSDNVMRPAQMIAPDDAFKLISLILPVLDSVHAYIGMKHTKLSDAFIKALDLIPGSDNAEWLKHYQDKHYRPEKWKLSPEIIDGSFPTVLKAVLQGRCPTESALTIGDVWSALDTLANVSNVNTRISNPNYTSAAKGGKDFSEKENRLLRIDAIRQVLQRGTSEDVAEFTRILLKDTEIRLSQDEFFAWFHPCAKQHYNQTHDMRKLIQDCHNPDFKMGNASVQLNRYASVLLTQRPSRKNLKSISERLCGEGDGQGVKDDTSERSASEASQFLTGEAKTFKYFLLEPKLDGERMELHMTRVYDDQGAQLNVNVRTFSRRGNDSSEMYANALRDIISETVRAESVILDGEIMIWDLLRDAWIPFSRFRDIATSISHNQVAEGSSYVLKFMVFDVLYVEQGRKRPDARVSSRAPHMVVRLPLHRRRQLLQRILRPGDRNNFPGLKSSVEIVSAERGRTEQDVLGALQRYCASGYEGVIAKNPDMPYAIGQRSADIAVKLKPDYFDGGLQDLDVLILGARLSTSYSRTGRSGDVSTFLIGVRDDRSLENSQARGTGLSEGWWIPVASVGTGYSDDDLDRIRSQLKEHWQKFDSKHLPSHFSRRTYPKLMFKDVVKWIPPSKSIVLTITAYELIRKQCALRFPRVERINWEKPVHDVITLQELQVLDEEKTPAFVRPDNADADGQGSQFVVGNETQDDTEAAAIARATAEGAHVSGGRSARAVLSSARGADVKDVMVVCDAFQGLTFVVIGGETERKEEIEIMIYELGGKFVQNLTEHVNLIIGLDPSYVTLGRIISRFESDPEDLSVRPVVRPSWVDRCRDKGQKLNLLWPDLLFAPSKLQSRLFQLADKFGDPWVEETTSGGLLQCIESINRAREEDASRDFPEIQDGNAEDLVAGALRQGSSLLKGWTFWVPKDELASISGAALLVRLLGGTIESDLEPNLGKMYKVLVGSERKDDWQRRISKVHGGNEIEVVTDEWVRNVLKSGSDCKSDTNY